MSFSSEIAHFWRSGVECSRIDFPLTVTGPQGEAGCSFRFDTGCDITMVSEDVATALGLPSGGRPITVAGSTGTAAGRLVPVIFRFPPDEISGLPEAEVFSMWIVTGARTQLALVGLQDVHAHFAVGTDDTYMYFTNR